MSSMLSIVEPQQQAVERYRTEDKSNCEAEIGFSLRLMR